MNTKLFIDDERMPPNDGSEWIIARSSTDAIDKCLQGVPSFVSFDHDLGGEDTAMIFVRWIVEQDMDKTGFIPDDFSFYVHSQNPIGRQNIERYLNGYLNYRKQLDSTD